MDEVAHLLDRSALASLSDVLQETQAHPAPPPYAFILDLGNDPEERLENAILWKVLSDRLGKNIAAYNNQRDVPETVTHVFGRASLRHDSFGPDCIYPGPTEMHLAYWEMPAFLELAGRSFKVCDLDEASAEVGRLHAQGKDAFVKATRAKYFTSAVPQGTSLYEALDSMAYSFLDSGPCLMVQEHVEMSYEYRLFVVNGRIVTGAGCIPSRTPLDNTALYDPAMSKTPKDTDLAGTEMSHLRLDQYLAFAGDAVNRIGHGSFVLDVAMINGEPGIVELNPLRLGQVGLYAADARVLVDAILEQFG